MTRHTSLRHLATVSCTLTPLPFLFSDSDGDRSLRSLTFQARSNPLFITMLFAWSVTEVIRYTFYFLSLLHIDIYALNWCRYTFFLVLYPLGAGSEAFLSFSTLPPLRTLPYLPKVLGAFHDLLHSMPKQFTKVAMKTQPVRALLWSVARARAAKSAGGSWTRIEVARLVLFVIWWPGMSTARGSRRQSNGGGRGE